MSDVAPAAVVLDLDLFSTIELPPKESDLVAADHDFPSIEKGNIVDLRRLAEPLSAATGGAASNQTTTSAYDGGVEVKDSGGDAEELAPEGDKGGIVSDPPLEKGDRVEARRDGSPSGAFSRGSIDKVKYDAATSATLYTVNFDDGTTAEGVSRDHICKVIEVICLGDVLKMKSEFDGIAKTGRFAMFLLVCALIPILFLDPGGAESRGAVNMASASYVDSEGNEELYKDNQVSVHTRAKYMNGVVRSWLNSAQDLGYLDEEVRLGVATVKQIWITFDIEFNNNDAVVPCPPTSGNVCTPRWGSEAAREAAKDLLSNNDVLDFKCHLVSDATYSGSAGSCSLLLYGAPRSISSSLEVLDEFEEQYSLLLPGWRYLELFVMYQNDYSPEKSDGGVTALNENGIYGFPFRTRSLYSSHPRDISRAILEIVFLVAAAWGFIEEERDKRMTWGALGSRRAYYLNPWNVLDLVGIFVQAVTILAYYGVMLPLVEPVFAAGTWSGPWPRQQWAKGIFWGPWPGETVTFEWAFFGWVLNFVITGFRLFQYFRFHPGIAVYVKVFFVTWKSMRDFLVWFLFIILSLSVTFYLFFSVSGGHLLFANLGHAINMIALITMGFGDYDGLINDGIGIGIGGFFVIFMFWILVFLSIVFAQNIILATVGKAYDECSEVAVGCRPFVRVCASRIRYAWMRLRDLEGFHIDDRNKASVIALQKAHLAHRKSSLRAGDVSFRSKPVVMLKEELRLQERKECYEKWSAVLAPAMAAIYAYFQHPLHLETTLDFWLWDNGAAINEADAKLRRRGRGEQLWHDTDWSTQGASRKAATFLQRPLTKIQFQAILDEVSMVEKLLNFRTGVFGEKYVLRTSSSTAKFLWDRQHAKQKGGWIDSIFDAFKEESIEDPRKGSKEAEDFDNHPIGAKPTKGTSKRPSPLYNKQRHVAKMDGIESQVLELKRSIEDLRVEQRAQLEAQREEMKREREELKQQIKDIQLEQFAKFGELLAAGRIGAPTPS